MKLTKSEFDELIKKHPNLRPIPECVLNQSGLIVVDEASAYSKEYEDYFDPTTGEYRIIPPQRPIGVKFTIPGQPVSKPRMTRQDHWRKRPCVEKFWKWKALALSSVPIQPTLSVYREVHFVAYLRIPSSYPKKKKSSLSGQPHLGRMDSDNILKALMDSLFKQDKYIWKFSGEKRWEDEKGPRLEVELR